LVRAHSGGITVPALMSKLAANIKADGEEYWAYRQTNTIYWRDLDEHFQVNLQDLIRKGRLKVEESSLDIYRLQDYSYTPLKDGSGSIFY
jgi:hypothetical protein